MSATTAGAFKAHIEGLGLGVAVYRDRMPDPTKLPAIVVREGISIDRVPMGDTMDPGGEKVVAELVQVDLYQLWRNSDGTPGENYPLAGRLHRALDGVRLPTAPTIVSGVLVANHVRLLEVDGPRFGTTVAGSNPAGADGANVVHDALTCRVRRNL